MAGEGAFGGAASAQIDAKIAALGDWRSETLARLRALIHDALPDVVETVKWRKPSNPAGVPVWEAPPRGGKPGGIICTGDGFKDKVKLTFAKGATLDDPAGVFNNGLGGKAFRAIDLREGETVDAEAFKALVRAAADPSAVSSSVR
jgi:hypothetical protein